MADSDQLGESTEPAPQPPKPRDKKAEALAELEELRAEMALRQRKLPAEPVGGAPGGAFLGEQDTGEAPELFKKQPPRSLTRRFVEGAVDAAPAIYAGMKGAEKGYELGSKTGIPLAGFTGAVTLGPLYSLGAETAYQEAKRNLGIGEHTDSFRESLAHGFSAASDTAVAETWGRITNPVMSNLKPFRTDYTPEEMGNMTAMSDRLRGVYEKVTGRPINESKVSWNPMRRNQTLAEDVDNSAISQRLQAAGLNPDQARKVVLANGQTIGDLTDNRLYAALQRFVGNSQASREFKGTRGKMMQMAITDLGDKFGKSVPPEDLGEVISRAVDGKFNTLVANRNLGMNATQMALGTDFKFSGRKLKLGYASATDGPMSLIANLSDAPTFKEVQQVREALGVMAHDTNVADAQRAAAGSAAQYLDKRVGEQLSGDAKKFYKLWQGADDEYNRGQFNTAFVQGLVNNKEGYKAYAEKILKNGDVGNFKKFEAAVGPDIANQVRANIWERVSSGAVSADGQIMNPRFMQNQLKADGKYGEKFLRATMGDDVINGYTKMADAMQTLNEKAKLKGFTNGLGQGAAATATGAGALIGTMLGGHVHADVALKIGAILGAPAVVAKVMQSDRAIKLSSKLAEAVGNGQSGRATRLAAYVAEAAKLTPEEFLMTSGAAPGPLQTVQKWRHQLSEGQFPWKETAKSAGKAVVGSLSTDLSGETPGVVRN